MTIGTMLTTLYALTCLHLISAEWTVKLSGLQGNQNAHPQNLILDIFWSEDIGRSSNVTLNLRMGDKSPKAVPLYEANDSGQINLVRINDLSHTVLYHDVANKAAMSLTRRPDGYFIRGSFETPDGKYGLEPYSPRIHKRSLADSDDDEMGHIRQHVVKRETFISDLVSDAVDAELGDAEAEIQQTAERIRREAAASSKRIRRSTDDVMTVNLYMIVDSKLYEKMVIWHGQFNWTGTVDDFTTYTLSHIVHEMDLRFSGITTLSYQIRVQLGYILLAKTVETSTWTQVNVDEEAGKTDAPASLAALKTWANDADNNLPADADHFMLFTGYNLYFANSGSATVMGYAYYNGVCKPNRVSVTEYLAYSTIVAHELGHNLGARHDGDNNVCLGSDQFVMSSGTSPTSLANLGNGWLFSDCSIEYFDSHIQSLINDDLNCLADTGGVVTSWTDDMSTKIGQVLDINKQCVMRFGDGAGFAGGVEYAEEVCRKIYCYTPSSKSIKTTTGAFPFTTCGHKKWCVNETCVESADAPSADPACPLGEHPGALFSSLDQTCADSLVTPRKCYEAYTEKMCCQSCAAVYRPDNRVDCEYGDKHSLCANANYPKACYLQGKRCCESCPIHEMPWLGGNCTYGDKATWCANTVNAGNCALQVDNCCSTCCDSNGALDGFKCSVPRTKTDILAELDAECSSRHGASYVFVGGADEALTDICTALNCVDPGASNAFHVFTGQAPNFTYCGDGKWCHNGYCVEHDAAPSLNDDVCPLGERRGPAKSGGSDTCQQVADDDLKSCYNLEAACCQSCPDNAKSYLGEACKYGDRATYCSIVLAADWCDRAEVFSVYCCDTCCSVLGAAEGAACQP